jgi:hypothetical protein
MRLAIGTDNKQTVCRGLFGDSSYFCIRQQRRSAIGKQPKILTFLGDCDVFVSRSRRKGSLLLLVVGDNVEQHALQNYWLSIALLVQIGEALNVRGTKSKEMFSGCRGDCLIANVDGD